MIFFKWFQLNCQVDVYILETKIVGTGDIFTRLYKGRECSFTMHDVPYGKTVAARIKAKNRAGSGAVSDEMMISMPEGK